MEESTSSVTHIDSEGRKFTSTVEAVYNRMGLTDKEAQRVNNTPGLIELIEDFIAKGRLTELFRSEEVPSNFGYSSGYRKPIAIEAQIDILRSYWPQLNPDNAIRYAREVYPTLSFPDWVEGPFAVVRPGFFSNKYIEEIEEVFSALKKSRGDRLGNSYSKYMDRFRTMGYSSIAYGRITESQNGSDILIVGSQFGIRHRGRSHRRTREVIKEVPGEFGESVKNVGTMLLTHPNRLDHDDDLWISCLDDEFDDPVSYVRFHHTAGFSFSGGKIWFGVSWNDHAYMNKGAVSTFVPKF